MDLPRLIESLADPAAYPFAVDLIEVRQTHISAVFLAGEWVYKVKKPVAPGFLDFTTLEKRLHFCREEVRLNHRLAGDVYFGVVPIVETPAGVRLEAEGNPIEWAVKMRRLPDEATLLERLRRGEVRPELVEELARRLAAFHRDAETDDRIAAFGQFSAVSRNILDIYEQALPRVGETVSRRVFERTRTLAREFLHRLRPLIDDRARRGIPRDCHGDLHLDHIYHLPDRAPPGDLAIIDCIEFNERFRFIDPVADMAFATMDFEYHGRRDLAQAFSDAYFHASGDDEGRELLSLYVAYRATVRGMVEGLLKGEKEVPVAERAAALARARGHWLLALGALAPPGERPCLLLVGGLPGTGKSTLARRLAEEAGFGVIRSDVVRKELAGIPIDFPTPSERREELYSSESTERTYRECLHRAEQHLFEGNRVIVDATFREERYRRMFRAAATRNGVPFLFFGCAARPETIQSRLAARRDDASDADWEVHTRLRADWEHPASELARLYHSLSTEESTENAVKETLDVLRDHGLLAS